MPYFSRGGIEIYYEGAQPRPSGDVFLFLHGLGGSTRQARSAFTHIPEGISMVYMDLRGNGNSAMGDPRELSFETLAGDVEALCALLGLGEIIIGGISMGAGVATAFCLRRPGAVKKLVIIRPAWLDRPMAPDIRAGMAQIAGLIRRWGPAQGKERYLGSGRYRRMEAEYPANARSNAAAFDYPRAAESAEKYVIMPADRPMERLEDLEGIRVPALILANRRDPPHPLEYGEAYHRHLAGSEFYEIPSKNLDPEGHSRELNRRLRRFLEGRAAADN